jgi:hypothetical protein
VTRTPRSTEDLHGRQTLAPVFDALNVYVATTHFNGQSTVELDGDRATSESYCPSVSCLPSPLLPNSSVPGRSRHSPSPSIGSATSGWPLQLENSWPRRG